MFSWCFTFTERPRCWQVQGRGELALAILVEQCVEGFELTVGKPVSGYGKENDDKNAESYGIWRDH